MKEKTVANSDFNHHGMIALEEHRRNVLSIATGLLGRHLKVHKCMRDIALAREVLLATQLARAAHSLCT